MPISIPQFCVAVKSANSCGETLKLAEKLQTYFKSKVTTFLLGASESGIPTGYNIVKIAGEKDIVKEFKSAEFDLLILPLQTNGTDGTVNSIEANKLIDKIERMVLTVPCNGKAFDLTQLIVPIDSSFETRQKVPYAVAMARAFGSTLHVIGVSNDKSKDTEVLIKNYLRQVCNNIEEKGVKCTQHIQLGGNPTNIVLEYAAEKKAGMVVIMTEQETNLTAFFSGKYSQQMVKAAEIPVLSIHPKDLIVSEARL